jgi:cysteine desulfurase/selenocysteine lyase
LQRLLGELYPAKTATATPATPANELSATYYFQQGEQNYWDAAPRAANPALAAPFDIHAVRRDFPILAERVNGKQLVWFDNAATTQKPQSVIDRLSYFYAHENSNIHRAAHELAARATDAYEGARNTVARFLGAASPEKLSSFAVQRKRLIWSPILSVKSLSVPVMRSSCRNLSIMPTSFRGNSWRQKRAQ